MSDIELTILMPCLNEAETLETCILKAKKFLIDSGVNGEILIADNGSTDGSQKIALKNGVRVENVPQKGYGAALIGGCNAARGKYVIMGDADDSYDFTNLMPFLAKLREGYDLVMGNRFKGGIAKGAMPSLHRYLGNPVLSFIGRLFYPSSIKDFHCGLRGYNTKSIRELNLRTTGMEYASEMVVQATLHKLKITEVPTTLSPDGRSRPPHLRSWRDGWRHLKFLLMHSPNWLFLYPGLLCLVVGLIATVVLAFTPVTVGKVTFDINALLYSALLTIIGLEMIIFSVFTKEYAVQAKMIPVTRSFSILEKITLEMGVVIGLVLIFFGVLIFLAVLVVWGNVSFGDLDPRFVMRVTIPSAASVINGLQLVFASFFLGILKINIRKN